MDFESPDVMKDFPGLYASELNKKSSNDSEYNDDVDKHCKKDSLIGKKKDKKDKKDKEKGYAALEGESSADENSKSPSKSKKAKAFKFSSKHKDKRDKSKEKEVVEKKKDRDKKMCKKAEKEKVKFDKRVKSGSTGEILIDALPIFGVSLEVAVERSRCHDGIDIPLPVREAIDYVEKYGMYFESIYKIAGAKSKVLHIRKLYNQREAVIWTEYDVPTATSLLKLFLRELPEPIFSNELVVRFEEAGAILNLSTRAKHLKILVDNLPALNRLLLSWFIVHLDNICTNEKHNKMNRNNISVALCNTLHISSRLLNALLHHSSVLFPNVVIKPYVPPLPPGSSLPDDPELIEVELIKQESLLNQIHKELNVGCITKNREEMLWEVQRIITQLKRKLKTTQKEKATSLKNPETEKAEAEEEEEEDDKPEVGEISTQEVPIVATEPKKEDEGFREKCSRSDEIADSIEFLKLKNCALLELKESLLKRIEEERKQIVVFKSKLQNCALPTIPPLPPGDNIDQVMDLLNKENQILQIKKINLVRQVIEQQELCIDLKSFIDLREKAIST